MKPIRLCKKLRVDLFENLKEKSLIKKLNKSPYYEITEQIEKVGILESLEKLDKIHLGHMDKVKKILRPYFTKA